MIYSLEGLVVRTLANEIFLAIGPVTLRLFVPITALALLTPSQSLQKLYISLVWRDTGPQLYGFCASEHVEIFERLQTVSGVGPKLALSILGHYAPDQLATYLQAGDDKSLSRIPGIGQKTAQRLIVELKDKASEWNFSSGTASTHPMATDGLKALLNLGYSPKEAQRMIEHASRQETAKDLSSLISLALQMAKS